MINFDQNTRVLDLESQTSLLNLISRQADIDKIQLYAKDPQETKYQLLINKGEIIRLNHFNDSKGFIGYSNNIDDICKNIEEYNSGKERKILVVFDIMVADILSNEERSPTGTKLFARGRKLNIPLVFIPQSYFSVPQNITLNCTHYFIMKIPNKQELQEKTF